MPTAASDEADETAASPLALDDVMMIPLLDSRSPTDDDDDDDGSEAEGDDTAFPHDDALDFSHLADDYVRPLFAHPSSDPSARIEAAYRCRDIARAAYDAARGERDACERGAADRLGGLHSLLRESREREARAARTAGERGAIACELELQEAGDEFGERMGRLRAFVKRYRRLPPSSGERGPDGAEGGCSDAASADLVGWIDEQRAAAALSNLPPHHLASLENVGVTFPLSDDDAWHRSLQAFQLYSRAYWDSPILVQSTDGDLVGSVIEEHAEDDDRKALRDWCRAQRGQYQQDGFKSDEDRYTKLVNAGFTFDVLASDSEWEEHVKLVEKFKTRFGHVHIPSNYTAPLSTSLEEDADTSKTSSPTPIAARLQNFIAKVTTVVHRDALSPKRLSRLRETGLYTAMGGGVYDCHVEYCKSGRKERGEVQRTKRKFKALALIAEKGQGQLTKSVKPKIIRGNMDNWNSKLEKLVAHKEKYGTIMNIQGDVKLQGWIFSTIRKLSINSASLKGEKMMIIDRHEGLMEFLMQKENLEAALEYAKIKKLDVAEGKRKKQGAEEGGNGLEDLAEDVLFGNTEDHELNAFMEVESEIV